MSEKEVKSLFIDKISFELSSEYILSSECLENERIFTPFHSNSTLEHGRIVKNNLTVEWFVDYLSSWIGVEEYVYSKLFNYDIPKMRKFFLFRDEFPAVIVQTTGPNSDNPTISDNQRRRKSCYLTVAIMLSHAIVITLRAKIESSTDWDEVHIIMNSIQFSNPIPEGRLKLNTCVNTYDNLEMILPSVFCTTFEEGRKPIPRKFTESLFNRTNLIFEIVSPHIPNSVLPADVYCGFSLYKVFADNLPDFIEKYQNEHAPAPEKIDQNLKVKNILCRFFHFKSDQHTFMDCIFQHPKFKMEIFIFSIFVDRFVSPRQMGVYVSSILNCIETMEITTPVMSSVKSIFHYESRHYKFQMYLPSDSLIIENPVPLSTDCIMSISSQIVLLLRFPKRQLTGSCRTQVSKITRKVPEYEEPDPEKLAILRHDQLVKVYSEDCVSVGMLNDEWTTRYTYTQNGKFVVGTYIFYNASEIYLFETEVVSDNDAVNDQVVCLHNTITFT